MKMKYLALFVICSVVFVMVTSAPVADEEQLEFEEGAKKTAKRGIYGGLGYGYGGLGYHGLYGGYGYPTSYLYPYRLGYGGYGGFYPFGYHGYGYYGGYGF